jgi:ubiquinone/menaquinone biosynthesis C-methylase UbiE
MHIFDSFSHDYEGNLSHPLRRWFGIDQASLVDQKIRQLRNVLASTGGISTDTAVLDYGCGTGDFLRALSNDLQINEGLGLDVSEGMIAEAQKRNNYLHIRFGVVGQSVAEAFEGHFDVAVVSSVLHHVERKDWGAVFTDIFRLLKPDGRLVIIEHNPLNLVTQLAVKTTPVDKGVKLARPREIGASIKEIGLVMSRASYFLVYPPAWPASNIIDRRLKFLPIGGQWVSVVWRAADSHG